MRITATTAVMRARALTGVPLIEATPERVSILVSVRVMDLDMLTTPATRTGPAIPTRQIIIISRHPGRVARLVHTTGMAGGFHTLTAMKTSSIRTTTNTSSTTIRVGAKTSQPLERAAALRLHLAVQQPQNFLVEPVPHLEAIPCPRHVTDHDVDS